MSALLRDLESAVGSGGCLWRPDELLPYECDGLTLEGRQAAAVVLPRSREEVQAVVRACRRHGVCFVPRGAGTGLSGGALADGAGVSWFAPGSAPRAAETTVSIYAVRLAWGAF